MILKVTNNITRLIYAVIIDIGEEYDWYQPFKTI